MWRVSTYFREETEGLIPSGQGWCVALIGPRRINRRETVGGQDDGENSRSNDSSYPGLYLSLSSIVIIPVVL